MQIKLLLSYLLLLSFSIKAQSSEIQDLFKNHKDGYNMFRIPTIIASGSGKILAFCEGRKNLMDNGDIDLVMKSSNDNGKTWSKLKLIWSEGKHTCGNPSPVFDKVSGDIIVVATLDNDKVFILRSKDEGENWEKPVEITSSVKAADWKWYAAGPVHAIQLEQAPFKNRIVVPCNHTVAGTDKHISHIIYSDDSGKTWQLGGSVSKEKTDECTVVELANGLLLLNMRNGDRSSPCRKVSISSDAGLSWTEPQFDSGLPEPICQGSLLRYSFQPDIIVFSNPKHKKSRKKLSLSISKDGGKTWTKQLSIHSKKSAYSDLVLLKNGDILCIFETGKVLPYGGIFFKTIRRKDIE